MILVKGGMLQDEDNNMQHHVPHVFVSAQWLTLDEKQ